MPLRLHIHWPWNGASCKPWNPARLCVGGPQKFSTKPVHFTPLPVRPRTGQFNSLEGSFETFPGCPSARREIQWVWIHCNLVPFHRKGNRKPNNKLVPVCSGLFHFFIMQVPLENSSVLSTPGWLVILVPRLVCSLPTSLRKHLITDWTDHQWNEKRSPWLIFFTTVPSKPNTEIASKDQLKKYWLKKWVCEWMKKSI